MESLDYVPPSNDQIAAAQKELGFTFTQDYIDFIKSGYDMGDSILEPLEIDSPGSHLDIFETFASAKKHYELPTGLLPICEDNSDYYCLNSKGEVVFWSHNGQTDETWPSIHLWREQMIAEA
ncbi:MAG: SMI1/KNR4 family protein [Synoicihabitans sp.]